MRPTLPGGRTVVTSVRVNLDVVRSESRPSAERLIAFATVILDGSLIINDIRVIRTDDGKIIVSMPSRKKTDGTYRDVTHPINSDLRSHINKAVIAAVLAKDQERKCEK